MLQRHELQESTAGNVQELGTTLRGQNDETAMDREGLHHAIMNPGADQLGAFYGTSFSNEGYQNLMDSNADERMMGMEEMGDLGDARIMAAQTPEEILQRRNTMQVRATRPSMGEMPSRRASMLDFGTGVNEDLDFGFDPKPRPRSPTGISNGGGIAQRRLDANRTRSGSSSTSTAIDRLQYFSMEACYGDMTQSPAFEPGLQPVMTMPASYNPQEMSMAMDFTVDMNTSMPGDLSAMNMFSSNDFTSTIDTSMFPTTMAASMQDPGGAIDLAIKQSFMNGMQGIEVGEPMAEVQMAAIARSNPSDSSMPKAAAFSQPPAPPAPLAPPEPPELPAIVSEPNPSYVLERNGCIKPAPSDIHENRYSASGFDMLGVLMRVATRPDPQVKIGPVDLACAFVVCDLTQHDIPIVYCSEVFERLTGYTKHEILGQNCRFLQAPDGKKQSGKDTDNMVDDSTVRHIRKKVEMREEVQVSLINYRKGGQPFTNILTMIPIKMDGEKFRYYVGFQVDLVELPASIEYKNPDGSHYMNYQRGLLPKYVFNPPAIGLAKDVAMGQTISRDEVSHALSTFGTGGAELSKRVWDKILLENSDDVVHVLSLKGLFLYLSPSSKRILEYEPHELVGTALSSVCHPSDIVPVTRELKDTSTGAAVSVVFRFRRKRSGYTWFECHGGLHTEQGKGKKCIILVGRERPVYTLARTDLRVVGGIGEGELWTKMSTSGMFLFVPTNVKALLDRVPDELVGTSAQALMRPDCRAEFGRCLDIARTGLRTTFKHDFHHKRGHTLHASTTLYPGDAKHGEKPTFIVAQTRFPKMARHGHRSHSTTDSGSKSERTSAGSDTSITLTGTLGSNRSTGETNVLSEGIITQAGGNRLAIGNQDEALASEDNVFEELKTTRSTSWQFELRQMERRNRLLAEELHSLMQNKKKRKRRKGQGQLQKDCVNCHTRSTPEWRRGPSGDRDLCNSCGLRWAKQNGRISPRTTSHYSDKGSGSSGRGAKLGDTPESSSIERARSAHDIARDLHMAKMSKREATSFGGYAGGIPSRIDKVEDAL